MSGLRKWVRTGSPQGVAINATATAHLSTNLTYHALLLDFTSTLLNLEEIRVVANGVAIHRYTGVQLDALARYYGRAASGTNLQIFIDFDRRGIRARGGQEISGIGTAPFNAETNPRPISSFSLEVDFGALAGPVLSVAALVSKGTPSGAVRKVRPFTHNPSAAGDFQIGDLPKGDVILAAHFNSALITAMRLEVNQIVRHDLTKAENDRVVNDGFEDRTAQANYYHFDPASDGHGSEWLKTSDAEDLRFVATVSGATTIASLVEYLGPVAA